MSISLGNNDGITTEMRDVGRNVADMERSIREGIDAIAGDLDALNHSAIDIHSQLATSNELMLRLLELLEPVCKKLSKGLL